MAQSPERKVQYMKQYYQLNKEKAQRYYQDNKDKILQYGSSYYENNKNRIHYPWYSKKKYGNLWEAHRTLLKLSHSLKMEGINCGSDIQCRRIDKKTLGNHESSRKRKYVVCDGEFNSNASQRNNENSAKENRSITVIRRRTGSPDVVRNVAVY